MFTGIIQEIGTIKNASKNEDITVFEIEAHNTSPKLKNGDSVNINGICSTITDQNPSANTKTTFTVQYIPETLKKTTAESWTKNTKVNLEPALTVSDKFNGHFVSGHVDGIGEIIKIHEGEKTKEIEISFSPEFSQFIALKGSITVDGVSLTISNLEDESFTVSLIPHTIENTILGALKKGDKVNLEIDLLSRYLKRLFDARDEQTSYEFLKDRGFI